MPKDLSISLIDRPGTLAAASDALGRAGINIDGVAGYTCDGRGIYHVLVDEAERARRALIDAGFEILEERRVAVVPIADRPGAAAALLRHVAEAGVNVDLMYLSATGRLVLGGPDVPGIERALG